MMDIRTYLSQGKPLLFDGAMGTYFAAHPGRAEERCERANLTRPEEILRIHRAYLQAGCRAIKTNTFAISVDLGGRRNIKKPVCMEPSLKYHPLMAGVLTWTRNPGCGQCLVGSLTGAVSS